MQRYIPLVLVVGLLIAFRALGSAFPETLPNFQPLAAVFFCGALLAPGWRGFALPFAAWAITFPLGVGHLSNDPFVFSTTLLALGAVSLFGKLLSHRGIPTLLLGSVGAAFLFHFVTNTAAWLGDPLYAKTFTGFWQSQWSGPVGSAVPSWVFLRNLVAANVIYTAIFAVAQLRLPKISLPVSAPELAKSR